MKREQFEAMIEDLEEAANMENAELGDWWDALTTLGYYIRNCGSEEFFDAWEAEVIAEHTRLKRDFKIHESVATFTRVNKRLEYLPK